MIGLIMMAGSNLVQAQKYRTALGVRIAKESVGLTVQQKILPKSTLEGLGMIGSREASGTLLFEQHFPIIFKGFNYYIGAGAHVGNLKDSGVFYGGDAILGLEMKLPIFRIVISGDIKPAFHANHEDWFELQRGFSVRYILVKEKKKKFRLFGNSDEDEKSGGIFNRKKKKEEPKRSFWLFGDGEE
ncbi:hypothetical protein [Adhaeribacter soli]|nr:hypothetical protein [Adhaeribacter soli]